MSVLGGMLFTCAVVLIAALSAVGLWVLSRPSAPVGMRAPWPAPDYQRMLDAANAAWSAAQPRPSWAPPVVREMRTWFAGSGRHVADPDGPDTGAIWWPVKEGAL